MLNNVRLQVAKLSGRIADKPPIKGIIRFIRHHMKSLGVALLGMCAALIGVYAARISNLQVKLPISDAVLWVMIAIFFVSGLSLSIIGIIQTWGDITPRQRKRDGRLRTHFEDMQKISSNIIPTLIINWGRIYLNSSNPADEINENTPRELPNDFIAHFQQEAKAWNTYCLRITAHNKKYAEFELKMKGFFVSSGLKVIPDNQPQCTSPCIYEAVFHLLFIWWRDRFNHRVPNIDFTRVDTDIPMVGTSRFFIAGWPATAIFYADNESDRDKCKDVIARLAHDADFEKEAASLIKLATELIKSVADLRSQLIKRIDNIDKYWPGTRDYKFKKLKQCQTCKKIA